MRMHYDLTDETRKVLKDNVGEIAAEASVNDSYLYQVLSSVESDFFAKFDRFYGAAVRAGSDVTPWDVRLQRHKTKQGEKTIHQCLTDKLESDADTACKLVDAIKDGDIDAREREQIERAIAKERDCLDRLEATMALYVREETKQRASRAVVAKFGRRG